MNLTRMGPALSQWSRSSSVPLISTCWSSAAPLTSLPRNPPNTPALIFAAHM